MLTACLVCCFFVSDALSELHSSPTRRSSDLGLNRLGIIVRAGRARKFTFAPIYAGMMCRDLARLDELDRKSTRLNSSHVAISYAVFCLKKKKHHHIS